MYCMNYIPLTLFYEAGFTDDEIIFGVTFTILSFWRLTDSRLPIESFRFYDEGENEYEVWLPVCSENTNEIYNPQA